MSDVQKSIHYLGRSLHSATTLYSYREKPLNMNLQADAGTEYDQHIAINLFELKPGMNLQVCCRCQGK
jgi:hypothetical protein